MSLREDFQRDGFALVKSVFSGDRLSELQTDFDRIVAQITVAGEDVNARWSKAQEGSVVVHTHNVQQYSAAWLKAFTCEEFMRPVREILGDDVVLHHSKLFQKPPEIGADFPLHQDWSYFPTEQDTMIAAVIHLSDATQEMGCLQVAPGSQRLGRLDDSSGHAVLPEFDPAAMVACPAEPGDVLFFHYFTVHGSGPNRSQKTRKTVLVQMHSGQDKVEDGITHPNARLTLSGWNHRATRGSANAD